MHTCLNIVVEQHAIIQTYSNYIYIYLYTHPLVNYHNNEISPFLIGNTSSKGPFSIAMLDYRSLYECVSF